MLNKVLQMISSNVKANVKQQQIKIWQLHLKSTKKYSSIPSSVILSVKNRVWGVLLNRKKSVKSGKSYLFMVPNIEFFKTLVNG